MQDPFAPRRKRSSRRADPFLPTLLAAWLLGLALALMPPPAEARDDDPPGRVGRIAEASGRVSIWDAERGQWSEAVRNRVLTRGDRISTEHEARAELRVGSTVLRLSGGTELELLRLDDERLHAFLHAGSLALRLRSSEIAAETEVFTGEGRFAPGRAGHYRFDRNDDVTQASTWRGEMRVLMAGGFEIEAGQSVELVRERRAGPGGGFEIRQRRSLPPEDGFAAWVLGEDRQAERFASSQYVSPEMTGAEELDRHGRWERHPEFGPVWVPISVRAGWAPYRYGRWAWVRPWGWTWIDEAPWGFAVSHYGRWAPWRGGWAWVPGAYVARPVWAPALVTFTGGGPGWSVTVGLGAPPVAWAPLPYPSPYKPWYRHTPVYGQRINPQPWQPHPQPHPPRPHPYPQPQPPGHVPTGPIMYGPQGTPSGVQAVPRDALRPAGEVAAVPAAPAAPAMVGPERRARDPDTVVDLRRDRSGERPLDRPSEGRLERPREPRPAVAEPVVRVAPQVPQGLDDRKRRPEPPQRPERHEREMTR